MTEIDSNKKLGWEVVTPENKMPGEVGTTETWLELRHWNGFGNHEPIDNIDFSAVLKWDGCCHLNIGQHGSEEDYKLGRNKPDYVHLCDGSAGLDELIKQLQELKRRGVEKFGKEWKEYW